MGRSSKTADWLGVGLGSRDVDVIEAGVRRGRHYVCYSDRGWRPGQESGWEIVSWCWVLKRCCDNLCSAVVRRDCGVWEEKEVSVLEVWQRQGLDEEWCDGWWRMTRVGCGWNQYIT